MVNELKYLQLMSRYLMMLNFMLSDE